MLLLRLCLAPAAAAAAAAAAVSVAVMAQQLLEKLLADWMVTVAAWDPRAVALGGTVSQMGVR